MEFNNTQAIYLQIADYVCDQVQLQHWPPEGKVPSVRELAVNLEVNPNTIMRSYEYLQQQGIIYTRRGLGYYVSEDALRKVIALRKEQFLQEELPQFFRKMFLLGVELDELKARFEKFKTRQAKA
ncbi:GntR family transcriptional regulator [Chitinophaga niabensis]|jgi:DNA-binding transcriptional regulator YhcF (GntR family)|uniref:GntR family transcriptional regulator n=1 Tax=Chitinophaga TaxID=79328 RepID=UPI001299F062|nr:GntR family transcriptional regulator [Chitinophaga sp. SYP-B3965]MRG48843.1 GntR family transcriptional regulator [Chitinophaga sp. SYP-B3965]